MGLKYLQIYSIYSLYSIFFDVGSHHPLTFRFCIFIFCDLLLSFSLSIFLLRRPYLLTVVDLAGADEEIWCDNMGAVDVEVTLGTIIAEEVYHTLFVDVRLEFLGFLAPPLPGPAIPAFPTFWYPPPLRLEIRRHRGSVSFNFWKSDYLQKFTGMDDAIIYSSFLYVFFFLLLRFSLHFQLNFLW